MAETEKAPAPKIPARKAKNLKPAAKGPDRLPALERELAERIKYLRGCVREIGRRYSEGLERDLAELLDQSREVLRQQRLKPGPRISAAEDILDVIEGLRLKPEKGRRKDLRRIEQAVSQMEKALAKKKSEGPVRVAVAVGRGADIAPTILQALARNLDRYSSCHRRCREAAAPDAVHDLRVSIRRLLSILRLMEPVLPKLELGGTIRRLRAQLNGLSRLRDAQVQRQAAAAAAESQARLAGFIDYLSRAESALLVQLPASLGAIDPAVLAQAIQPAKLQLETAPSLASRISKVLRRQWRRCRGRLLGRRQALKPEDPATIHRLRIAFKRYRYLAEALQPLLPAATPAMMKSMHGFQQAMGRIQDQAVLVRQLQAWLRKTGRTDQALFRFLQDRRNELEAGARQFVSGSEQLNDFLNLG
jgi:CHAD domain-containing protein